MPKKVVVRSLVLSFKVAFKKFEDLRYFERYLTELELNFTAGDLIQSGDISRQFSIPVEIIANDGGYIPSELIIAILTKVGSSEVLTKGIDIKLNDVKIVGVTTIE